VSESYPTPAERRGWHYRGASTPTRPLAAEGCSARGLLALLAGRDDEPAVTAREALAAALTAGRLDAIRGAMDAARQVLPPPAIDPAEARAAELARTFAENELLGMPSADDEHDEAHDETPRGLDPADVLARLDALLSGELPRSQRWNLEQHRRDLARAMGQGPKTLAGHARRAADALDTHAAEVERRRVSAAKRQRTLAGKALATGTGDTAGAPALASNESDDAHDYPHEAA